MGTLASPPKRGKQSSKSTNGTTRTNEPQTKETDQEQIIEGHTYAWWEGYRSSRPRCANPYKTDVEPHQEWRDGWETRYFGEMP